MKRDFATASNLIRAALGDKAVGQLDTSRQRRKFADSRGIVHLCWSLPLTDNDEHNRKLIKDRLAGKV